MSVVADIAESWFRPSRVVRRHLSRGRSEAFAFTFLVVFFLISLIARWPAAARVSALTPEVPVAPQLLPFALGGLAAIPFLYALAALGQIVSRAMGGRGSWYGGRVALFWALVATTPLVLLSGLVAGLIGPGVQLNAVSVATLGAFAVFWAINLREEGRPNAA